MNKSSSSHITKVEVSKGLSQNFSPEKIAPEVAPEAPESSVPAPETVEVSRDQDIDAKKEEIKAEPAAEIPAKTPVPPQAAAAASHIGGYVSGADLRNLKNLPREEQVKYLTEIVYQKGLDRAIATVRHLNDPYLLDLLHDTLVDELFQKLKGPKIGKK